MRVSEVYRSKFMRASDVPTGRELRVTIDYVELETMEQTGDEKLVVYLVDNQRGLVLNVTNANTVVDAYGDDCDTWTGKPLVLFATTTTFAGKRVPCIRVKVPAGERPDAINVNQELASVETDDVPFDV